MPNKDSFTFSDKLKKSKSLPLSKRIPSRVGGDGKAKRTLIQRAQRDLPFIIVAAAALLLLPLLSRNGDSEMSGYDSIGGYEDWVQGGAGNSGYDIGGDSDITPVEGYRDPLSLIKFKSGQDSPATESWEPENTSDYVRNTPEPTQETTTSTYRPTIQRSVRNAVQRTAAKTIKGKLSGRDMRFGGGGSGLSRNLAIGGAPTRGASVSAPRAGVRPVALQPLTSAGGGRVLTGEGYYAEADRAARAMNQGPAKQALFEAQLRDVDGAPLGAAGDPRRGAARMGGGGSTPNGKFNYTNQKPWWWDMMNERSQKLWELWNYNWQKALSDGLIKVSTNLAMCLLTGSEDGSVKNFLGIKPGDDSTICINPETGKQVGKSFEDFAATFQGTAGENGSTSALSPEVYTMWTKMCEDMGGAPGEDPAGQKNALQARLECLGLKKGKMDWATKTRYNSSCESVNQRPLTFKVSATSKGGKTRDKKQEKLVLYVLAQDRRLDTNKGAGNPFVIKLNQPGRNALRIDEEELDKINKNCVIISVGYVRARDAETVQEKLKAGKSMDEKGYYTGLDSKLATLESLEAKHEASKDLADGDVNKITAAEIKEMADLQAELKEHRAKIKASGKASGRYLSNAVENSYSSTFLTKVEKGYNYCTGGSSAFPLKDGANLDQNELITRVDLANEFDLRNKEENILLSFQNECKVYDFQAEFKDLNIIPQIGNKTKVNCFNKKTNYLTAAPSEFSAEISNVASVEKVYAVAVEDGYKGDERGVWIRKIVPFNYDSNENYSEVLDRGSVEGSKESRIYTVPSFQIGAKSNKTSDTKVSPGHGKVFWIVTPMENKLKAADVFIPATNVERVKVGDLVKIGDLDKDLTGAYKLEVCDYSWGCNAAECPLTGDEPPTMEDNYCAVQDGSTYKLYDAIRIPNGEKDVYIQSNVAEVKGKKMEEFLKAKGALDQEGKPCPSCLDNLVKTNQIPLCTPICKKVLENMQATGRNVHERDTDGKSKGEPLFDTSVSDVDIAGLNTLLAGPEANRLCPFCNTTPAEIYETCNFTSFVEFANTRFSLDSYDKNATTAGAAVRTYGDMYSSFVNCLETIANNTKPTNQQLFITGFTSKAGSTIQKCPVYGGTPDENGAVVADDGTGLMANYSPNGYGDKEAAKNCNKALSEDRSVYSLHKIIDDLNSDPELADLKSKISVTINSSAQGQYVGFRNTKKEESGNVDKYFRYPNRKDSKTFGNGSISVVVNTKGCGPEGATGENVDADRAIYFTHSDQACNRAGYKGIIAQAGK